MNKIPYQSQRYDLVDCRLAVGDEAPVGDLPAMVRCIFPEHDDSTPSMAVYCDHIFCYRCNKGIHRANDALAALLGVTWQELRRPDANGVTLRDKYTLASLDAYRERAALQANQEPLPYALATGYSTFLWGYRNNRVQWLLDRGLEQLQIARACVGHDGTRFTIPIFNRNNELIAIRFRRDDYYGTESWDGKPLPRYSGMKGRNGLYLYGGNWLSTSEEHVVVCEGELDALRLIQEGIPAVGVTNGAGNLRHIPKLIEPYTNIKRVYVCSDVDEPGRVAAAGLQKDLIKLGYKCIITEWSPVYGKDVTEYLKSGGTMKDAGYRG